MQLDSRTAVLENMLVFADLSGTVAERGHSLARFLELLAADKDIEVAERAHVDGLIQLARGKPLERQMIYTRLLKGGGYPIEIRILPFALQRIAEGCPQQRLHALRILGDARAEQPGIHKILHPLPSCERGYVRYVSRVDARHRRYARRAAPGIVGGYICCFFIVCGRIIRLRVAARRVGITSYCIGIRDSERNKRCQSQKQCIHIISPFSYLRRIAP